MRRPKRLFDTEPVGLQGINDVYVQEIAPHLRKLERRRKWAVRWGHIKLISRIIPIALLGAAIGACVVLAFVTQVNTVPVIRALGVTVRRIYDGAYAWARAVKQEHKHLVLRSLAGYLGIAYRPNGIEDILNHHKDHGLLPTARRVECDDGFKGEIEGTPFQMTEVEVMVSRDDELVFGDPREFRGICLSIQIPKRFHGRTVVISGESDWQPVRKGARSSQSEVRLEDPEFARVFDVFADDQVESRYLLTPSMMERLLAVAQIHNDLAAVFADGRLHISFSCLEAFNAGTFKSRLTDPELVKEALEDVLYAGSIVADLSVNQRARV